jgi:autotransporter-associated beta strand protein
MKPKNHRFAKAPFIFASSIALIATAGLAHAANGTWSVDADGLWSAEANWSGGTVADEVGATANFSTVNITEDRTVSLDSPRTVGALVFADASTPSHGWTLDNNASPTNVLTLEQTTGVPTITVNNLGAGKETNISLSLAGTQGLNKGGVGTLVLSGNNTISGPVSVLASSNGVMRLDSGGVLNATTLDVASPGTNSFTNQLAVAGGTLTVSGVTTLRAGSTTRYGVIVINSGTANFNGGLEGSNATAPALFRVNGGNVSMASYKGFRSAAAADDFSQGFIAAGGSTTITGDAVVADGANFGAMSIEGGTVAVGGSMTLFGPNQSNTRTVSLRVTGGGLKVANSSNGLVFLTKSSAGNIVNATFSGGTSTIEKITMAAAGVNNGTMNLTLSGGNLYLGAGGVTTVATSSTRVITWQTGTLGADASWSSNLAMSTSASGADSVTIKAANEANDPFDIALNGPISGAGGIVKTGGGSLTLGGANTLFTGSIQVNAGTLLINGSTAPESAISLSLSTATTLGGTGTVGAPINVPAGATLAPGTTSTIGTLKTADLSFASGAVYDVDIDANTADQLAVTGDLNLGGATLLATSLGGSPENDAVFTIATCTGTLSGTFSGLPQNAVVQISGIDYTISYAANSVTLTAGEVLGSPYEAWAAAKITSLNPAADATPSGDPDNDGVSNLSEFAFNGDPLSGSDNGRVYLLTADSDYAGDPSSAKELILTVAVLSEAPTFAGSPSPSSTVGGITYTIQGGTALGPFGSIVNVVPTPITSGLPAAGTGYEYRSFSLDGSDGLAGKGFLRAKVSN